MGGLFFVVKKQTKNFMRKLFLLILFLAFIAILFSLMSAERGGVGLFSYSGQARPSDKPLPEAWSGADRAQVRSGWAGPLDAAGEPDATTSNAAACPATVRVERGDTLGAIARRCGVRLNDLLAANPAITNPNRIEVGQEIHIYGERGGGASESVTAQPVSSDQPAAGFAPGAEVTVTASGFPPGARVKIGLGLPGAGFQVLGTYEAGDDGSVSAALTIPASARRGERAFFLLSTTGAPTVSVISEPFLID